MEAVIGIVFLVAGVALIMWLGSLRDRAIGSAVGAVNRRVQPAKHAEGQAFIETTHVFGVDAPSSAVVEALAGKVMSRTAAPTVGFGETYLVATNDHQVEWAHGTSLHTNFRAVARIGSAELEGGKQQPVVAVQFVETTIADGLVAELASMKKLKTAVRQALSTIDSRVEELDFS